MATLANPFPNGLRQPAGPKGGLLTNLGQGLSFYDRNLKHPYSQKWSLGFQQLLSGSFVLEADYVGSRSTRIGVSNDINTTPREYLSTLPYRDEDVYASLSRQFANPFRNLDPIYGANMNRGNLLRPYPQFNGISYESSRGYTWFHSAQLQLQKRMSHGFSYQLSYTWSKAMMATAYLNPTDAALNESISDFDRPHRLVTSAVWLLPLGRGRAVGSSWNALLDAVVGGWRLAPLITYQSGPPLAFGNVIFNGDIKAIALSSSERNADRWFNTGAGFNRNSNQQLVNNIRTFPQRFAGIRADGVSRWDISLIKDFQIREGMKVEIRAEAYNALNHTNLQAPNAQGMNPANSAFGTVTATNGGARSWQLGSKVRF